MILFLSFYVQSKGWLPARYESRSESGGWRAGGRRVLILRTANKKSSTKFNPPVGGPNKHQTQSSKLFKSLNFDYCVRQLAD